MRKPSLRYEKNLWRKGCRFVAGIDEAGRGPLAGPVVAAAVVIKVPSPFCKRGRARVGDIDDCLAVRDSKLLSPRQREILYQKIIIHPQIDWGIGIVSEKVIDEINILEATKLAMIKAVANLSRKPDWLLIDGNNSMLLVMTNKTTRQRTIIAGDKKVFSIACASIVAKVTRDKIMTDLHKIYPQYGFSQHKGYGTKLHFAKLAQCGVSPVHRRSFHPVSEFVFP